MPITGSCLAKRFQNATKHLAVYVTSIRHEVLPVFSNLAGTSQIVVEREHDRLASQPAIGGVDDDLSTRSEVAQEEGRFYYSTMDSLRRASPALYVVGLFHLLEQQLAAAGRDNSVDVGPPSDTKLEVTRKRYQKTSVSIFCKLPAWSAMDELRVLADIVKHGEGKSAQELRKLRPDLFGAPTLFGSTLGFVKAQTAPIVQHPLAGEHIFISEGLSAEYGHSVHQFVIGSARDFESRANAEFFTHELTDAPPPA